MLRTITISSDLASPCVRELRRVAILYEEEGAVKVPGSTLDTLARRLLGLYREEPQVVLYMHQYLTRYTSLTEGYATFKQTDEVLTERRAAEQALVNELMVFYADPEGFAIIHVQDSQAGKRHGSCVSLRMLRRQQRGTEAWDSSGALHRLQLLILSFQQLQSVNSAVHPMPYDCFLLNGWSITRAPSLPQFQQLEVQLFGFACSFPRPSFLCFLRV